MDTRVLIPCIGRPGVRLGGAHAIGVSLDEQKCANCRVGNSVRASPGQRSTCWLKKLIVRFEWYPKSNTSEGVRANQRGVPRLFHHLDFKNFARLSLERIRSKFWAKSSPNGRIPRCPW